MCHVIHCMIARVIASCKVVLRLQGGDAAHALGVESSLQAIEEARDIMDSELQRGTESLSVTLRTRRRCSQLGGRTESCT